MTCDCYWWVEEMGYIDELIFIFCLSQGKDWVGKDFRFCPWCGKGLENES